MISNIDAIWVILSAHFVFLMQAGFLCLEAGTTQRKNSINVAIKNLADLGLSTILFWALGYGLMFGASHQGWIGFNQFAPDFSQIGGWVAVFFLFQSMFCSTAVTILSGAVAGRMTFKGYLITSVFISGLIYPIFGHWAWNGLLKSTTTGWLAQKGFVDFAGSTVVHSVGGWAALAALLIMGPRNGRFSKKRHQGNVTQADPPLAFLGALLLWLGWFGFNGGSTLAFNQQVPIVLLNTLLAGASGLVTCILWTIIRQKAVSVSLVMNGALAGLVAITAGCHAVSSINALIIGAIGSLVMIAIEKGLERLYVDDAVGAIPVHLGGGIWGTAAVAIFGKLDALGTGLSHIAQLKVQVSGIIACGLWTFPISLLVFYGMNRWSVLRVTRKQEYLGLNITEHGAHSEFHDLYRVMKDHARTGDLVDRAPTNAFSEIGQISRWYNQVVQSLEKAIAKNEAIITTAVDGITTVTPHNLIITSVNPAIHTIFGHGPQLIGQPLTQLMKHGNPAENVGTLLSHACQTGAVLDAIGLHRNGQRFPIEITATESSIANEIFWTIMIRDVTNRQMAEAKLKESELVAIAERKHAQELQTIITQLKQTQAQLIQGEKMASLGRLVAGVAHEINNPMSFIQGNLDCAKNYIQDLLEVLDGYQMHTSGLSPEGQDRIDNVDIEFLKDDFPRLLGSMQNGTNRIRDIVKSLRNFAHHDEAELKLVDVHQGIDNTLMLLAHDFYRPGEQKAIDLEKYYGDLPKVECYASALNQVFLNILSNAIEALAEESDPAKSLAIKIITHHHSESEHIIIVIEDNGPGISESTQQKIFDPFFTTKPIGQGTGMGLAISHQIVVDKHKGQLNCYSTLGQGSKFEIILPMSQQEKSPQQKRGEIQKRSSVVEG